MMGSNAVLRGRGGWLLLAAGVGEVVAPKAEAAATALLGTPHACSAGTPTTLWALAL
jgi:hypothetical protein